MDDMIEKFKEKNPQNLLKIKRKPTQNELEFEEESLKKRGESLYKQYSKSLEYFKKSGNYKMAEDSRTKLLIIREAIKHLNSSEGEKDIQLPKDIDSEYICQCTKEERTNTFKLIIDDFKRRIEKLKDMNKDYSKLSSVLSKLVEMQKNEFIPPPLYLVCEEEVEEKVNKEIEENTMNVLIENKTGLNENMFFKASLDINNNEQICKSLELNQDLETQFNIELKDKEFKNLFKKDLNIHIYRNRRNCCWPFNHQKLGTINLSLRPLKSLSEINGNYSLNPLSNSQRNIQIRASIKIRKSIVDKEYLTKAGTYINIIKVFPPFSLD